MVKYILIKLGGGVITEVVSEEPVTAASLIKAIKVRMAPLPPTQFYRLVWRDVEVEGDAKLEAKEENMQEEIVQVLIEEDTSLVGTYCHEAKRHDYADITILELQPQGTAMWCTVYEFEIHHDLDYTDIGLFFRSDCDSWAHFRGSWARGEEQTVILKHGEHELCLSIAELYPNGPGARNYEPNVSQNRYPFTLYNEDGDIANYVALRRKLKHGTPTLKNKSGEFPEFAPQLTKTGDAFGHLTIVEGGNDGKGQGQGEFGKGGKGSGKYKGEYWYTRDPPFGRCSKEWRKRQPGTGGMGQNESRSVVAPHSLSPQSQWYGQGFMMAEAGPSEACEKSDNCTRRLLSQ